MNDPGLNSLLKWSVENSDASLNDPSATRSSTSKLDPEALQQLLGGLSGPSDAQLMQAYMEVIEQEDADLAAKRLAFENFGQLVEGIDNANNMESLGLWTPLVGQLENADAELRMHAAWCCGIAVQNNIRSQERLLVIGAIPTLVRMATQDPEQKVRKKAILAISSIVRNFQPGLDAALSNMPAEFKPQDKLDATNMESVDSLINNLRASV